MAAPSWAEASAYDSTRFSVRASGLTPTGREASSDWGATHSTAASALAGMDLSMPGGTLLGPDYYGAPLKAAVQGEGGLDAAARERLVGHTRTLVEHIRQEVRHVDFWQKVDAWGYDSLWNFDHFYPIFVPDPNGPCMESWTTLSALSQT